MIKVQVKVFATLQQYLKEKKKIIDLEVEDGATVIDVIRKLNLPEEVVKIAVIEGRKVDLKEKLRNGDMVSLFPIIAGGCSNFNLKVKSIGFEI